MSAKKTTKKKSGKPSHRAHLFYTGRVQGVGFRYTAEAIAHEVGVLGWVKNLQDGRVEVLCEGPKELLESFFSRIQESVLGRHIKNVEISWETPTGEFSDFTVEFCY